MIKLSDRLQTIANFINPGETIADIGTDHGFLPIALFERGISPHVILSDINRGPLEKAGDNIKEYCPGNTFDIRLGNGLSTLNKGEVDTIVIAGMGGLLIANILGADMEKTKSYGRLILQPRNAQDKLRKWILENQFSIVDEALVKEGKYICEIIVAEPITTQSKLVKKPTELRVNDLELEFSPILFHKKDPLLSQFIANKIRIEKKIIRDILNGSNDKNRQKLNASTERLVLLEGLLKRSEYNEYEF